MRKAIKYNFESPLFHFVSANDITAATLRVILIIYNQQVIGYVIDNFQYLQSAVFIRRIRRIIAVRLLLSIFRLYRLKFTIAYTFCGIYIYSNSLFQNRKALMGNNENEFTTVNVVFLKNITKNKKYFCILSLNLWFLF